MTSTNYEIQRNLNLPVINTVKDLSYNLHLSERLLYNLSNFPEHYNKPMEIRKKSGKIRQITSPKGSLRVVQSWILINILEKVPISRVAMGFRRGSDFGIKPNATIHKDNEYILRLDLEDFFPSITRKQVYPIFLGLGYSVLISNVLTDFCLLKGRLPQGASTSPYISNVVFRGIDERILEFCNNTHITYTRYADDLIFSSDSKSSLEDLLRKLENMFNSTNFKINSKKTKLMGPNCRKVVTGLLVNNDRVRIKRETRRNIRAMIFEDIIKESGSIKSRTKGYLSFVRFIEPDLFEKFQEYIAKLEIKKGNLSAATSNEDNS